MPTICHHVLVCLKFIDLRLLAVVVYNLRMIFNSIQTCQSQNRFKSADSRVKADYVLSGGSTVFVPVV